TLLSTASKVDVDTSFTRWIHRTKAVSQALRMPVVVNCMRLRRPRILFGNATSPVTRTSREAISRKISPLRRTEAEALADAAILSTMEHSLRKMPMQEVTSWQFSASAEQSDTRRIVSSLEDAVTMSGMSLGTSDSSCIQYV